VADIEKTKNIVRTAYDLSAAHGARFIFVFIPDKFRALHEFCQFPAESACRNWTVNDLPERMRETIGSIASDIGFLDLTPKLAAAVKGGATPYYPDDEHWEPAGHRIAAEAINSYMGSTGQSARAFAAAKGMQ
jgi:hypothetical protein